MLCQQNSIYKFNLSWLIKIYRMKKDFFCSEVDLNKNEYIIKFFESFKDELIIFKDKKKSIKSFSSVCPHLAGQIRYKSNQIYCRWHGLKYDENGNTINSNVKLSLREYKTLNIDGNIYIEHE